MTTRILPRDEYHRLHGTEADGVIAQIPEDATVVVVERDGAIVGCHVLSRVLVAECLWIAPGARGRGGVARRLWAEVRRVAREHWKASVLMTTATDDRVRRLLAHVGATKLPGEQYVILLKG